MTEDMSAPRYHHTAIGGAMSHDRTRARAYAAWALRGRGLRLCVKDIIAAASPGAAHRFHLPQLLESREDPVVGASHECDPAVGSCRSSQHALPLMRLQHHVPSPPRHKAGLQRDRAEKLQALVRKSRQFSRREMHRIHGSYAL